LNSFENVANVQDDVGLLVVVSLFLQVGSLPERQFQGLLHAGALLLGA